MDRYATETNRLLVRLERLLTSLPPEGGRRRAHEQGVVAWVDESLVSLCPSCARAFSLGRRKHHCRLCGSVLCQECSHFLHFQLARKLLSPSLLSAYRVTATPTLERQEDRLDSSSVGSPPTSSNLFQLRRSNSRSELLR